VKRLAVLALLLLLIFLAFYRGYATAPQVVDRVEIEIRGSKSGWKSEITQYVLNLVKPGESVDMEELTYLKEKLESLPWVETCSLSISSRTLTVKVVEAKPALALFFDGYTYLLNKKGYVLERLEGVANFSPIYYYKGKSSPFVVENDFVKIKHVLKTQIELISRKLQTSAAFGEKPEVTLTEAGAGLIFKSSRMIVYLDNSENAWNNFIGFKGAIGRLQPGVYDFRFYDMLVRGAK
jgi:hypothetical protein